MVIATLPKVGMFWEERKQEWKPLAGCHLFYQGFLFIVSVQKILLLSTEYRIECLATSAHKLLSASLQSQYLPSLQRKSTVSFLQSI